MRARGPLTGLLGGSFNPAHGAHRAISLAAIYAENDKPCLPVALNAGLFWPRRSFIRRRGKILVEFLEPIAPGLPRREVEARVHEAINALDQ